MRRKAGVGLTAALAVLVLILSGTPAHAGHAATRGFVNMFKQGQPVASWSSVVADASTFIEVNVPLPRREVAKFTRLCGADTVGVLILIGSTSAVSGMCERGPWGFQVIGQIEDATGQITAHDANVNVQVHVVAI